MNDMNDFENCGYKCKKEKKLDLTGTTITAEIANMSLLKFKMAQWKRPVIFEKKNDLGSNVRRTEM